MLKSEKMGTVEEVSAYCEAMTNKSIAECVCPRCILVAPGLKTNVIQHLQRKRPCTMALSAVQCSH